MLMIKDKNERNYVYNMINGNKNNLTKSKMKIETKTKRTYITSVFL